MIYALIAVLIAQAVYTYVVAGVIDHFRTDCKHEYGDWCSYPDEHAYVQQKQCKKCQFTYTYQERKIGHEQHQHNNVHKG